MKHLKKFEICDVIYTEKGHVRFDQMFAFPFYVNNNMETKFGLYGHGHYQMWILDDELIRGRIFYKEKVIGFWELDSYKGDLRELFEIIQRDLRKTDLYKDMKTKYKDLSEEEMQEINSLEPVEEVDFFDGTWRIDVVFENEEDMDLANKKGYYTYNGWGKTLSALIPIEDFLSGDYKIGDDKNAYIQHLKTAEEKERDKQEKIKKGEEVFPKGWGSKTYDDKLPKDMTPAQYQDSKTKYKFTESFSDFVNETCDSIYVGKAIDFDKAANIFPFRYSNTFLSIGTEKSTHGDNGFRDGMRGRIFYTQKVIAIWLIERYSTEDLKELLNDLLETPLIKLNNKQLKIKNLKGWCFDVAFKEVYRKPFSNTTFYDTEEGQDINNYDVDDETLKTWNLYKSKGYYTYISYDGSLCAFIPVEDYLTGDYKAVTNQKAYIKHLANAEEKERDKQEKIKKGEDVLPKGWGSRYYDEKKPSNMTSAQYKNILTKNKFTESFSDFVSENADSIENDCAPGNTTYIDNGYPIAWDLKKNKLIVGEYGTMHQDNGIVYAHFRKDNEGLYDAQGRIWLEEKMMAFWYYPTPEMFKKMIDGLEEELDEEIWNNDYQIEIAIKEGEEDAFYGYIDDYNYEFKYELIPIEEYVGSENASEKDLALHLMNAKQKEEYYKKHGRPKGWGSDLKAKKNPLEWEQAKRLSENADHVHTETGEYLDLDTEGAFPFIYSENDDIYDVEIGEDMTNHDENGWGFGYEKSGRYWYDEKIIAFWNVPKNIPKFMKKFSLKIGIHERNFDLFCKNWKVEVLEQGVYKLVPVCDFTGTEIDKDAYKLHLLNAKDKWKALKDSGYKPKFKNWKEWQKPFESKINECHFNELFEMRKEDLMKDNLQSLINQYDDEERAIEDFDWFYDELTNLNSGGYVYRVVFLPDLKYLNKELGTHWTISEENAKNLINSLYDMLETGMNEYDGDKEDYEPYIIEAKTEPDNIHFEYSMSAFCELPHEQEVNLKEESKIKIMSIKKV